MKTHAILRSVCILLMLTVNLSAFSQKQGEPKDKNWRVEIEPVSFILKGVAGSIMYSVSEDKKFSVGLYGASLDIPDRLKSGIFENVGQDTSNVRLGFELAVMARYNVTIFKQWESNPYVGLILGWEYFDINQPSYTEDVKLSTYLVTPYVGYEFYIYRQMLYLNPQLRSVFYLGPTSSVPSRPEALKSYFILPQVALGIRL